MDNITLSIHIPLINLFVCICFYYHSLPWLSSDQSHVQSPHSAQALTLHTRKAPCVEALFMIKSKCVTTAVSNLPGLAMQDNYLAVLHLRTELIRMWKGKSSLFLIFKNFFFFTYLLCGNTMLLLVKFNFLC